MKAKDRKLFNTAIHDIKKMVKAIAEERTVYHKEISDLRKQQTILRKKHDTDMKKLIRKGIKVVKELYRLYDDLTDEKGR